MNNKAKKLVATSLVGFTAFTAVPSIALADTAEAVPVQQLAIVLSDENIANEMTLYAIEKNNIDLNECSRLKAIFDEAYANKDIVFEAGKIIVNDSLNNKISNTDYNKIVSDMDVMNASIELGIVSFNQIDGMFVTTDLTTFTNNLAALPSNNKLISMQEVGARATNLNLGSLVSNNYADLEDYLTTQMSYNPSGAHAATTGVWIARVRPGGIWDYKTKAGYSPYNKEFNCTYGAGSSKTGIRTSEFIGNYNYGYTGSMLYTLSILKAGSTAVSGFDPKDVDDYPAITEGYNDANSIE